MNIQVFNLSLNIGNTDLTKLFSPFGTVNSVNVVRDKLNGRSKGNALIVMPIEAEAKQAIVSLNQTLMDGKKIKVSELNAAIEW